MVRALEPSRLSLRTGQTPFPDAKETPVSAQDEVAAALAGFAAAWNRNDAAAVAGCFVDDGSLINPFGGRADGRAGLDAMYSEYFAGMLGGTSTAVELTSVRLVESAHALVDGEQTITAPDGSTVLSVHIAALFRREGDRWLFVDSRPYSFASAPA
jgi:uncharacterized protein (TIGR02246 family)